MNEISDNLVDVTAFIHINRILFEKGNMENKDSRIRMNNYAQYTKFRLKRELPLKPIDIEVMGFVQTQLGYWYEGHPELKEYRDMIKAGKIPV